MSKSASRTLSMYLQTVSQLHRLCGQTVTIRHKQPSCSSALSPSLSVFIAWCKWTFT